MRLYLTYTNRRHNTYGSSVGGPAHLRGWHAGAEIQPGEDDDGRDQFAVLMTSGSNGHHGSTFLGTVTDTKDGPQWTPASLRAEALALAGMLPPDASGLTEPEVRALRVLIRQLRGWNARLAERQAELTAEAAEHEARAAELHAQWAAEREARTAGVQADLCGGCGVQITLNGRAGFYEATAPVVETDHRRLCHGQDGQLHYLVAMELDHEPSAAALAPTSDATHTPEPGASRNDADSVVFGPGDEIGWGSPGYRE